MQLRMYLREHSLTRVLPKGAHTLTIILMAVPLAGQGPECGRVPQGRDHSGMSETGSWTAIAQKQDGLRPPTLGRSWSSLM